MACHSDSDETPAGYWVEAIALAALVSFWALTWLVGICVT